MSQHYDEAACQRALSDLTTKAAAHNGHLVTWLGSEINGVIDKFFPYPRVDINSTPNQILDLVTQQLDLCQVWLDFLCVEDYQPGASMPTSAKLLWRRYYDGLAALYEIHAEDFANRPEDGDLWESWTPMLPNEYRRALRNWSRILLDPGNDWLIRDVLNQTPAGTVSMSVAEGWEEEVAQLLWRPDDQLRRFFREEETGQHFVDSVARRWFLPRYDLARVTQLCRTRIEAAQSTKTGESLSKGQRWLFWWLGHLFNERRGQPWLSIGILALLTAMGVWLGSDTLSGDALTRANHLPSAVVWSCAAEGSCLVGLILLFVVFVLSVSIGGGIFLGAHLLPRGRILLYPFSLRLLAGTIVGLIALSGLTEQFSDFLFHALHDLRTPTPVYSFCSSAVVLSVALGAAVLYTYVDANNRIGNTRLARRRTGLLAMLGWAQATLLAAGASWLGAGRLIPLGVSDKPPLAVGMILPGGILYFDYMIAGGILAFAIGVFTQILWEERAITDTL